MNNLHQEILERIMISTNANTEEIDRKSIFDAVVGSLDNPLSKSEFTNFFEGETSLIGTGFKKNFVLKLYNEYSGLHSYLLINRDKLK